MKTNNPGWMSVVRETLMILIGELIVSLATVGVWLLIDIFFEGVFDYTVITGLALGTAVTVANFLILGITVNRAVDKFLRERGESDMSEEEADAFAKQHMSSVQVAASGTYIMRTLLMLGALICAFALGDFFDVLATVIPLLMYRPIIYVSEFFRSKSNKKKEVR